MSVEFNLTPIEARKVWSSALRSGEFKQTKGMLNPTDKVGFCCLGVACELFRRHEPQHKLTVTWTNFGAFTYNNSSTVLPSVVAKWLNISAGGKFNEINGSSNNLIAMNDVQNKSFNEIADAIDSSEFLASANDTNNFA